MTRLQAKFGWFPRDGCEYSEAVRPNGKRRSDGRKSNLACRFDRSATAGDVTRAMAWVVSLGSNFLVSGLAPCPPAERAKERLVQAPKTSLHNNLGDATWHAAQVHHCDLDT